MRAAGCPSLSAPLTRPFASAPEFGGTLAALCRPLMQDAAPVAQVRRLTLYGNELTSVEVRNVQACREWLASRLARRGSRRLPHPRLMT